jgi:hypothetical protein
MVAELLEPHQVLQYESAAGYSVNIFEFFLESINGGFIEFYLCFAQFAVG